MPSRALSILVCAMTVLCPVFCTVELATHSHSSHGEDLTACSAGQRLHHEGSRPQHRHESKGEPVPHSAHVCICATGAPPGPVVQIPPLERTAVFVVQIFPISPTKGVIRSDRLASGPPDDRNLTEQTIPLLI